MAKLKWDQTGERYFETGVDQGVLYVKDTLGETTKGVAWNGLTGVTDSPSGAEPTNLYADNTKYLTLVSAEEFGGTIEAYMYPPEFGECDGSVELAPGVTIGQQDRKPFSLCYRTKIGNDVDGQNHGYKLHLIYGCMASPTEKNYTTINDSPEAATMSWEYTSTPVAVTGHKPTSCLVIDSRYVEEEKLKQLEAKLYGDESGEATLLTPDEVLAIVKPE